jgi:hypothetical protein
MASFRSHIPALGLDLNNPFTSLYSLFLDKVAGYLGTLATTVPSHLHPFFR